MSRFIKILILHFAIFGILFSSCKNERHDVHYTPIKIDSLRALLQPVNQSVIADVKTTHAERKEIPITVHVEGFIDYDGERFETIAARVSGRIEKLFLRYNFQTVNVGDKVMEIYSSELITAQQNLLYVIENDPLSTEMINNLHQRLITLGMTSAEINELIKTKKLLQTVTVYSMYHGHIHEQGSMDVTEGKQMNSIPENAVLNIKEGMYLDKGQNIFTIYNADKIWVILQIKMDDVSKIKIGQEVDFTVENEPGMEMTGKIDFIQRVYEQGENTLRARMYLDNSLHQHKIGSSVEADISIAAYSALWVDRNAVIDLGGSKVVLLKSNNAFHVTPVKTGMTQGDLIEVISGINEDDMIAANANYLIDSEGFIKPASNKSE